MLALDSTIGCFEASESEVLDLYRSAPVVTTSGSGSKPSSLEAYVCAIKKKTQVKVYLAFVADDRRIYVYTDPGKPKNDESHQHRVEDALAVARSMGFSPEPVDLNYSPAMRGVVLRNIKILRPPGGKVNAILKHGASGAPTLPIAKKPDPAQQQKQQTTRTAAPCAATPPVPVNPPITAAIPAAAPVPSPQPTPEPKDKEQEMHARSALSQLKKELQAVVAERDAQSVQLRQLTALQQVTTAELAGAREECVRVTVERDGLAQCKKQLDGVVAEKDALAQNLRELEALHQAAAAELTGSREDCARLTAQRDTLAQAAHGAEKASGDLASLQKEIAELSRQGDEASRRNLELGAESAALAESLARANQEVEKVVAERDAALEHAERLASESHETCAQSEAVRSELASFSAEKESALIRVEVLEQQKAEAEGESAALRGELEPLRAEKERTQVRVEVLEQQRAAAENELVALRSELASFSAEKESAQVRVEVLEQQRAAAENELVALRSTLASFSAEKESAQVRVEVLEQQRAAAEGESAVLRGESALLVDDGEKLLEKRTKRPQPGAAPLDAAPPAKAPLDNTDGRLTPELQPTDASTATERWTGRAELACSAAQSEEGAGTGTALEGPELTPFADLQGDFFSAADDDPSPGRFLLHADLTAIEYLCPDEVVELHQSTNKAYLSPDGKGQESCRGYICGLRKDSSLLVFAAIFGMQSGRTRVYLPEVQPEDEHAYARTVQGAISFAEEVGLMMEPVKLGSTPLQLHECLKRCPVLRNSGQK